MLVGLCPSVRHQSEALSLAREIASERVRGLALSRLIPYLAPSLRLSALDAAREIQDAWARATALSEMVGVLPDPVLGQVAGEALSASSGIADGWARELLEARRWPDAFQVAVRIESRVGLRRAGVLADVISKWSAVLHFDSLAGRMYILVGE